MRRELGAALVAAVFTLSVTPALAQTTDNAAATTAPAGAAGAGQVSEADKNFVTQAVRGGMAEVQLGQLASQKASNEQVKQFAQKMVADHGKANEELKAIAGKNGIAVPTDLGKHQKAVESLQGKAGEEFDKAYMTRMVRDHQRTIQLFEKNAKKAQSPELKTFAEKTLPVLSQHFTLAQETAKAVGAEVKDIGKKGKNKDKDKDDDSM